MKKVLFFAAVLTGLASCTDNKTTLFVQKVTDGQMLEIESTVSMNVPGDSIVITEVFSSGYGTRFLYYGNLAADMPEDQINIDSNSVFSKSYHVAVVQKVER
jgi:hypothetical protein